MEHPGRGRQAQLQGVGRQLNRDAFRNQQHQDLLTAANAGLAVWYHNTVTNN